MHPAFEVGISAVIGVNTVVMAMSYWSMPAAYENALEICNLVFTCVFTVEAGLKLVVLRRRYFSDWWNRFDFFIVVSSWVGVAVSLAGAVLPINPTILRVLRVFRVTRVFRLVKRASGEPLRGC